MQRTIIFGRLRPAGRAGTVAPQRHVLHRPQHGAWTLALHWSSAAAVLVAALSVLALQYAEDKALRAALIEVHRQAGLFVLLTLVLRLVLRFTRGMADFSEGAPRWVHGAALAAHGALYAVLAVLPVLGWAASSAHGVTLRLFGLLRLPELVAEDPDFADTLTDWHGWLAWGLLALLAAHIAAACWHHWARRDGVLAAMLPLIRRRRR